MYFSPPPKKLNRKIKVDKNTLKLYNENELYNTTYFSKEELRLIYEIFNSQNVSLERFSEILLYQGLSFLVQLPNSVEILSGYLTLENVGEDFDQKQHVKRLKSQLELLRMRNISYIFSLKDTEFQYLNQCREIKALRDSFSQLSQLLFEYIQKTYSTNGENPSTTHIIDTISIIARGTIKEKCELVFKLCKKKSDLSIFKSDLLEMISLIQPLYDILQEFGYGIIGTPSEIVHNIYQELQSLGRGHTFNFSLHSSFDVQTMVPIHNTYLNSSSTSTITKNPKKLPFPPQQSTNNPSANTITASSDSSIDIREFIRKSSKFHEVSRCFGFFDMIYLCFIKPVENHLSMKKKHKEFSGYLYYKKYIGFVKLFSLRYFEVRDRFLIGYKRIFSKPSMVICLLQTSVKILPKRKHSIFGNSEIKKSKEATEFIVKRYHDDSEVKFISIKSLKAKNFVNSIRENSKGSYRYLSYSTPREHINLDMYINGQEYFKKVYKLIKNAKTEVFIAGWWVCPRFILCKRDTSKDPEKYRLDNLLFKKAVEGVKIYILIWEETKFVLDLGSKLVRSLLERLGKRNIKVIRHPHLLPLYWSHHQKIIVVDQAIALIGGQDLGYGRYETDSFNLMDPNGVMYPGPDYQNTSINSNSLKTISDQCSLDRQKQPRMPWHDVSISLDGQAARDVAVNFIQRWNHAKDSNPRVYKKYPYLMISKEDLQHHHLLHKHHNLQEPKLGTCKVQLVRSVCGWSAGQPLENSIYRAYLHLIDISQHYIYIQNQFFISSIGQLSHPNNQVAFAIYNRIERAIVNNKIFRVFIVIPVHCEGDLYDIEVQLVANYTLKSIQNIRNELRKKFPEVDIDQYLTIHSLRNWEVYNEQVFTEQVYVHSKLMIVDDRVVLIGSANINDRSLSGNRDSEICAVIEDKKLIPSQMNGIEFYSSEFAFKLRERLWNLHLGYKKNNIHPLVSISDPVAPSTYFYWKNLSLYNTMIYQEIFKQVIPENCTKISQYKRNGVIRATNEVMEKLNQTKGYLIDFPLYMLHEDNDPSTVYSDLITKIKIFL
ncbi:hypothetical protein DLAC_11611 [Tieghemostelium lacteum]|uniref:phospholipase D n=1 Tax=Tieghemostelium lacteum TaxID=361077 RepID=A0A151ZIH1_TIELA|nr:hypothetical protein DLAC_11611 [Tieghemostelium lacteum]|eukprot:KYQ93680.1 hypothetical protein DLAC_11611 [Tieghemostelium lacteum]